MKTLVHTVIAIAILGSSSALAQIDSPHNYKRPVSQKSSQPQNTLAVSSEERETPLKLKNNVTSVHNYKRQGSVGFQQEVTLVLNAPVIGTTPQNPLLLPNHYKSQYKPMQTEERVARKKEKQPAKPDTLTK